MSEIDQMNVAIVGHVDHGKSTVVGRLLADTNSLPDGKLEQVRATCKRNAKPFEYAFLLDALKDEQAQGITIDVARCFFQTDARRYIIIDAPGHIEFLKNMVTGAARAEAAMIVIDAKEGIRENSKRHGYMTSMLGVSQVSVLVNKMDLVDYDQDVYDRIVREYTEFLKDLEVHPTSIIPISAFYGANIAAHADQMDWYDGPTVLQQFDLFKKPLPPTEHPFRFPVQDIYKFTESGDDRRILSGTVQTGSAGVGDAVTFLPSGKTSRIASIESFNTPEKQVATTGEAIGFTLDTQIYIRPGELMIRDDQKQPRLATRFRANVFWMGGAPFVKGKRYKLKIHAYRTQVELVDVVNVIDATELTSETNKQRVERHDVAEVILESPRPIAFDRIADIERTGRFVIVDNYEIAGCGIIFEELSEENSILAEHVQQREFDWDKGLVKPEQREFRNNHKGKFVVFTGANSEQLHTLAKTLEQHLFRKRCNSYYLGVSNLFEDLGEPSRVRPVSTDEHIHQLGEMARVMTDAGMLLITTLAEVDDFDLERLKLLNHPNELFVVNVGPNRFNRYPVDLTLAEDDDMHEEINTVIRELNAKEVLLDYCI